MWTRTKRGTATGALIRVSDYVVVETQGEGCGGVSLCREGRLKPIGGRRKDYMGAMRTVRTHLCV